MDPAQCAGSLAFKGTPRPAQAPTSGPGPRTPPSALSEGFPFSHLNDCRRAIFFSAIRQRGDVSTPWARSDTDRTGADRTGAGHTDRARTDKGGSVSGSWPNPTPRQRRSHLPVHNCAFGICVFGCQDLPPRKNRRFGRSSGFWFDVVGAWAAPACGSRAYSAFIASMEILTSTSSETKGANLPRS